jgi:hypothetical protein
MAKLSKVVKKGKKDYTKWTSVEKKRKKGGSLKNETKSTLWSCYFNNNNFSIPKKLIVI